MRRDAFLLVCKIRWDDVIHNLLCWSSELWIGNRVKGIKKILPGTLVLNYSLTQGQCLNFLNKCTDKPIMSWFFGGILSPKKSQVFTYRLGHQSYANKRFSHQATWPALLLCFWVSSLSYGKGLAVGCFQLHISVFASLKGRVLEWKEALDILDSKAFTVQVSKNQALRGLSLCTASLSQPMLFHSTPHLLRFPFSLCTGASPLPCPQAALSPQQVLLTPQEQAASHVSKVPFIHPLECWESDYTCHHRFLVQFFLYWSIGLQDTLWPKCLVQRFSWLPFLLVHMTREISSFMDFYLVENQI